MAHLLKGMLELWSRDSVLTEKHLRQARPENPAGKAIHHFKVVGLLGSLVTALVTHHRPG